MYSSKYLNGWCKLVNFLTGRVSESGINDVEREGIVDGESSRGIDGTWRRESLVEDEEEIEEGEKDAGIEVVSASYDWIGEKENIGTIVGTIRQRKMDSWKITSLEIKILFVMI